MGNTVHIVVDENYFDTVFEPKRKSLEKKLGIRLSQPKFTRYLTKKNLGLEITKLKGLPKLRRKL